MKIASLSERDVCNTAQAQMNSISIAHPSLVEKRCILARVNTFIALCNCLECAFSCCTLWTHFSTRDFEQRSKHD